MLKIKSQGTLVLPFQRINDLLNTTKTDQNKFHIARDSAVDEVRNRYSESSMGPIDFEVSGNRVIVTCESSGPDVKDTFRQSFDMVYSVLSKLLCLSMKDRDIENEDTLMAIRDITILSVEE